MIFWPIILLAISIWGWTSWGEANVVAIIPSIACAITGLFWFIGLRMNQKDKDQLDGVLDLFSFIDKWEIQTDGYTKGPAYVFMSSLPIVRWNPWHTTYEIFISKRKTSIRTNRYYKKQFQHQISLLHDAWELRALAEITKKAAA